MSKPLLNFSAKSPQTEPDPDEPAIDAKIRELNALRTAITIEIIAAEKAGNVLNRPKPSTEALHDRAIEFLGEIRPDRGRKTLEALHADREAIDCALVLANQRSIAAHGEIVRRRKIENAGAWADLVRRRALAIAALRRLNVEAEDFVSNLRSGGHSPNFTLEYRSIDLLGTDRWVGGPGYDFIQAALRGGFVTQKEIDQI